MDKRYRPTVAQAQISGNGVGGTVGFYQRGDGTLVVAQITGLPDSPTGFFGFHVHEGEGCGGTGFADTLGHLNFFRQPHPAHTGDLPPLLSDDGSAWMSVLTGRFTVEDVIGRTVVIHSQPDDFRSQPAGNAGEKIACGVITRVR